MSDQSVQNMVSIVKTFLEVFKTIVSNVVSDKSKEASALEKKLNQMEKEGKTKDDEYKKTQNELSALKKANVDFTKISEDTDKFIKTIDEKQDLREAIGNKYRKMAATEFGAKGITKKNIEDYDKLPADKKSEIDSIRRDALLNATEQLGLENGFKVPIATLAKDKGVLLERIEKAISKSKEFNIKNVKEDLNKIKNDLAK